ncbi:hypothetical protein POKO110462_21420 [Pontibacter korlensis]|uniref:hypothetical protein n=1 Tax=Pontibacter korlensis TaxID=400092 RepID=UPI0006981CDA|nr:hypothetical protein [Pontibacter korlensis]
MRNILSILFLIAACFACGIDGRNSNLGDERINSLEAVQEEPQRMGQPEEPDAAMFEKAYQQFFSALQAADTAALNNFIDAAQGFWLIEQPGAVPAYAHYATVQEVKWEYLQQPFTSINQQVKECQLQQRKAFPKFDCAAMDGGASGFSEDGCFYTFNTSSFKNSDMWQYASLSAQQEEQVQKLQQQVQATVLHTNSAFRFHFGYNKGRWQLLFADLRVPCSA